MRGRMCPLLTHALRIDFLTTLGFGSQFGAHTSMAHGSFGLAKFAAVHLHPLPAMGAAMGCMQVPHAPLVLLWCRAGRAWRKD